MATEATELPLPQETEAVTELDDPYDGLVCRSCAAPLTLGQPIAQSPDCDCLFHSACLIGMVAGSPWSTVWCPCDEGILFSPAAQGAAAGLTGGPGALEGIQDLLETLPPAAAIELAALRRAAAARNKACRLFRTKVIPARKVWREQKDPLVSELKFRQSNLLAALFSTPEARAYRAAHRKARQDLQAYVDKYALDDKQTRLVRHAAGYRYEYSLLPATKSRMKRRLFRIWI